MADSKISSTQNEGRLQAVKLAIEQIEKQYGRGAIMKMGEGVQEPVSVVSTGSLGVDIALGVGGLPRGRVVEIFGPEASGKTTLCLHIIAEAQKTGGVCAFIDAEHALDAKRAETIGVKLPDLLISQPDSGEQALEITETLIRSGGIDVVVIDSVAALVPKAELEGEMGEASMGVQARLMSQALRKLTAIISKSKTICIFTNQLRLKIGVFFGNPETTTGGMALKFYSSVRLDIRKIEQIKEGDVVVGGRHRVKVVKNKVAPPFRQAEFEILNTCGINQIGEILDLGVEQEIVQKAGASYKYGEVALGQGRAVASDFLRQNPKIQEEIKKKITEKMLNITSK